MSRLSRYAALVLALAAACGDSATPIPAGEARGPCLPDGSCASGLTCLSQVCVDATALDLAQEPPDAAMPDLAMVDLATVANASPTVTFAPHGADSQDVVLTYTVADADPSDTVSVTDLSWHDLSTGASGPITLSTRSASQDLGPCASSATGATVRTIWSSRSDLGPGNGHLVTVSVTVSDGKDTASASSAPFAVKNGPYADPVSWSLAAPGALSSTSDAFEVADVSRDGRPDLVSCRAGTPAGSGSVDVLTRQGRSYALSSVGSPTLPGSFSNPGTLNHFLSSTSHPGAIVAFDANDVDTFGARDLVMAEAYYGPHTSQPLLWNFAGSAITMPAVTAIAQDVGSNFAHVIAHQVTLTAIGTSAGLPNVGGATVESALASYSNMAPLVRFAGQSTSIWPPSATGNPTFDNIGWLVQDLLAANLDPPVSGGTPGAVATYETARATRKDLVMIDALSRLGSFLSTTDKSGAVVIRLFDPATKKLGAPYYLDPTDMGLLPVAGAVGDLLGAQRTTFGAPSFMLKAKDIVTANAGDCSLTFYYQLGPSTSAAAPPTFASYRLPLRLTIPGFSMIPDGDTVGVSIGDLDGDGNNDLVVLGQQSRTLLVLLYSADAAATGSLMPATNNRVPFRVGPIVDLPASLCERATLGDVDGDGRPDLLVACRGADQLLTFINKDAGGGTPSFSQVLHASTGAEPYGAALVDLDGDGRRDVVVANHGSGSFSTFLASPSGTLDDQYVSIPTGASPGLPAAGDLDGDGVPEVVVPTMGDDRITVYARSSLGLSPLRSYAAAPAMSTAAPLAARVVDLSGDGKNDLFTTLSLLQASSMTGHGAFAAVVGNPLATDIAARPDTGVASPTRGGAVGDLDGDTQPDVVLTNPGDVSLTLFHASATPFSYTPQKISLTRVPRQVEIVDLDNDGARDIVFTVPDGLDVLYNLGNGTFGAASHYTLSGYVDPDALAVGDLDNDGKLDVLCGALGAGGAAVLFNQGSRTFTAVALAADVGPSGVGIGDLDGDGKNDAVVSWPASNAVAVYYQNPSKTGVADALLGPVPYATGPSPYGVVIADLDGDGKNDLAVTTRGDGAIELFYQR